MVINMKKKIINNFFYLFIVIILLLLFPISASAESWWQNENALNLFGNVFDKGMESYMNPGTLNWYSVEPWEINICSKDFSTEFENKVSMTTLTVDNRNYALTIALNAEVQETQYTDENQNPEYLLTLGWYIQGIPEGSSTDKTVKYKVKLVPENTFIPLSSDGDQEMEFTVITGTSGFYSNYTTNKYREAIVIIDSQNYRFNIQGIDINGDEKSLDDIYG